MKCTYYECSNADCKFRFPSNEQLPNEFTCPLCKSRVTVITSLEVQAENVASIQGLANFPIEALLDNIRSALNVGSMFRTADGFGIRHLYLCGITPTPELKNVAKSSLGAEKTIRWTYERNGVERIHKLKEQKYSIVSVEEHKTAENLYSLDHIYFSTPLVLVVGNEICGVDPGILEMSDVILQIPMSGVKRSLNVAVAFGIAVSMLQLSLLKRSSRLC
jgi:23S rRNA (guanosine2251-2'-O)-methyltransferase